MEELVSVFNDAIEFNANYVAVKVILPEALYPEIIINPKENFSNQLQYYQETYNFECVHKKVGTIMIVDATWGADFDEIERYFQN
jgi:predicted small integral membrane protein